MLPVMLAECDSCNTSSVADETCGACALDVIESIHVFRDEKDWNYLETRQLGLASRRLTVLEFRKVFQTYSANTMAAGGSRGKSLTII